MAKVTDVDRKEENTQAFLQEVNILHKASVGVVLTRTREPFRVISALREFAAGPADCKFKAWTNIRGWTTYKAGTNEIEKSLDATIDPLKALQALAPTADKGLNAEYGDGIYVMMYPHFQLAQDGRVKHTGMVQMLKEFAHEFSACKKRLFLVTPQDFAIPPELIDDITILDFLPPSDEERTMLFHRLIDQLPEGKRPQFSMEDLAQINAVTAGMTSNEVCGALARSLTTHRALLPKVPPSEFIKVLSDIKTEAIRRSEVLELEQSENMANVGGLEGLKEWVAMRRSCFGKDARAFGVDTPKGIALIGPPGTGKSLAAKAIADSLRLPLIRFDVSRVFNSLVGSSEARVREALKMVDSMSPCVLMIDEVDKVFQSNSGGGDSGVGQRVLGALLTWMADNKSPVFMVVTANRVDNLPAEFLRKGRLDEVFSVSLPSDEERLEIVKIHLRKRKQNPDTIKDIEVAVDGSDGYVPAEIEAAVKDAILVAFATKVPLTGKLIAEQLSNMKPLSESFKEQFDMMRKWAEDNARPANRGTFGKHQETGVATSEGRGIDIG